MKLEHLALVLVFASACIVGRSATKAELIADIMKANAVEATLDATRADTIKQTDTVIKGALEQIRAARPQLSEACWAKMNAAAEKYLKAATSGWNSADLVKEYSRVYEERYSVDELTGLAAYLKTERAQKSLQTEKMAAKAMTDYMLSHIASSVQAALKVFISELQAIVREESAPRGEASPPQADPEASDRDP